MPCLNSFVWTQSTCQERVESGKTQNEKFLPRVGLGHRHWDSYAGPLTDWASRIWALSFYIDLYTYMFFRYQCINWYNMFEALWNRTYFVQFMYCIVLHTEIYLYPTNSTMMQKSCVFAFNTQTVPDLKRFTFKLLSIGLLYKGQVFKPG